MQIVSLIVIGLGLLIVYGGFIGLRSGRMQQAQFGSRASQPPTMLEGDSARRQGIGYLAAGIVLIVVGLLLAFGSPAVLLAAVGVLSLIGGVYLAFVGWQGILRRDVVFLLMIRNRTLASRIRSVRTISHHYSGAPAVIVGVGYLLLAAGLFVLGLILLRRVEWLAAGVMIAVLGCGLWLLSDAIASRISARSGSASPNPGDLEADEVTSG